MSVFKLFDRHAGLMDRMVGTLGLDFGDLMMRGQMPPSEYRDAVMRCTGCIQSEACRQWVDAHPQGAGHAPGYCRNRAYFDRLAQT